MTADRATLEGLLARVEAATGPDRKLEIAIAEALFPLRRLSPELERQLGYMPGALEPQIILPPRLAGRATEPVPDWTVSIDAALALVERCLPDCGVQIITNREWTTAVLLGHRDQIGNTKPTAPLAILAALLRALIASAP